MADLNYDAFISYRSTKKHVARALKNGMDRLAKAHHPERQFRVFLDEASLLVGNLSAEIQTALDRSRCMVVLLSKDVTESTWVDMEIEYWLAHGGAVDRLFLARTDDVNLDWRGDGWQSPEALPPTLRTLFKSEQKWLNLTDGKSATARGDQARLYAAIIDTPLESLLLDEAALERRRKAITVGIAAVMAVLLVASVGLGWWALASRNTAQTAAAEAQAEALAAQAVMAAPKSPVRAASLALSAAELSDSASVQSALLAVGSQSGHILHTVPAPEGQLVAKAMAPDDSTFVTISRPGEEPLLTVYDTISGEVTATADLERYTDDVMLVDSSTLLLCSPATGSWIAQVLGTTVELRELVQADLGFDPEFPEGVLGGCRMERVHDGVLMASRSGTTGYAIHHVTASGGARLIGESDEYLEAWNLHPGGDGDRVLVTTWDSAYTISTRGEPGLSPLDGLSVDFFSLRVIDTDSEGSFLISSTDDKTSWYILRRNGHSYEVEPVPTAGSVHAVAAQHVNGRIAGFVTLDENSEVTDELQNASGRVGNARGGDGTWRQYSPTLVRVSSDYSKEFSKYVAVFGSSAFVLDFTPQFPLGDGWLTMESGWVIHPIGISLGNPDVMGADPILASCETNVLLRTTGNSGPILVVEDGSYEVLEDDTWNEFDAECRLVTSSPSFSIRDRRGDETVLKSVTDFGDLLLGSDHSVSFNGEAPLEIYSHAELDAPWRVRADSRGGAATLNSDSNGVLSFSDRALFLQGGHPIAEVELKSGQTIAAVAPNGHAVVLSDEDGTIIPEILTPLGSESLMHCTDPDQFHTPRFVPPPGFATDRSLATEPVLVMRNSQDHDYVNCFTGESWVGLDPESLSEYEITTSGGRVVVQDRTDSSLRLVTWVGQDNPRVTTVAQENFERYSWSEDGNWFVTAVHDQPTVTISRTGGDKVTESRILDAGLGSGLMVQFLTDKGLLVIMNPAGEFILVDAATGFELGRGVTGVEVLGLFIAKWGDFVSVGLQTEAVGLGSATTFLDIPIGTDALTENLCAIYHDPNC
ncbi:toll/interleukin-1 receptor domain-containing protein [Tessaracoccus rhinocerotis]|nr:toll/interleukin-1 receptor domain-containing protein [Tessaracoccus rhinocerotis]